MMNSRIVSLTLIAVVVLLSSCSSIEFETVQPTHVNELVSMTDELKGTWVGEEGDKLKITSRWIKTPDMKYRLGDNCKLKVSNERYFLSLGEENEWSLIVAEVRGDEMTLWQFNVQTEEELAQLSKCTAVTIMNEDSQYDPSYHINPGHEEFERMLESDLKEELGVFNRK
ncbi:MAG: hypothetical protein ACI84C_002209 [Flavobacteriales bacterium]|jgi:hypothetical protein